jgi:hypothetical protein
MDKVSRRTAIKAFTGVGVALAASPLLLGVAGAAAKPGIFNTSGITSSTKLRQGSSTSAALQNAGGSESVVLHIKDGKITGYKGLREFVISDAEIISRISARMSE